MKNKIRYISTFILFLFTHNAITAHAISLDWKGYFRADNNYIRNYQLDSSAPGYTNSGNGGEYIKGQGEKHATYTTFFAKLKPSALINDNIILHSEWNIGDPVTGFFGRSVPTIDRGNGASTQKDALSVEAARLWIDAHTDFGLVQVGRAPMHWGLGVIFNSGDEPFDRFQSTSDTIRFISKFGYFSVMPLYAKVGVGKNLAGSQDATGLGVISNGSDDVTDYGVGLKFHNPEDDIEAGFLFYRRDASDQQDAFYYPHDAANTSFRAGANGMHLRLLDLYAKKTWYRLTIMGELANYSGSIGDINSVGKRNQYKATGFATETRLDFDRWHHMLRLGYTPGQEPQATGNRSNNFNAMYFHRAYKLGQILFRYNLGNFGSNNPDSVGGISATNVKSPYDASIVNAKYLMLATENKGINWSWSLGLVLARASETAAKGKDFYNHRTRSYSNVAAVESQSNNLGWEFDAGVGYHWDENIRFGADFGFFVPGEYFAFDNNVIGKGKHDSMMALSFSAMARF